MTKNEIIEAAERLLSKEDGLWVASIEDLMEFADFVEELERERCVKAVWWCTPRSARTSTEYLVTRKILSYITNKELLNEQADSSL